MTASIRLGRIAGVMVGVNWSVLIIFVLIAWGLAAGRFPAAYPGNPAWLYLAAGIVAALVFFLGLLAHEISHAIVAKRNGLSVQDITLWLFGGVAQLRGEVSNPGAELRIAGVGPLVSLVVGLVFLGIAMVVNPVGHAGLLHGVLLWLGGINIAIAVFNVLPAAPLDGGRLLRAALWKWRGDRVWAAVVSARAGRVLGAVLIAIGLWRFVLTGVFGALWLALIGWFLFGAAAREEQEAQVGPALAGVRVGEVMSPNPDSAPPDISVAEFIDRYLLGHRHSAFPLTADGQPVGLVTLDRVRHVPPERRDSTRLRDIACPREELAVASPQEPLDQLLPRLTACADGRALVVDDQRLVGILTPTDVSRALAHAGLRGEITHRPA
jgi:Zn-dependent protease/predicted transcriptional regulator